MLGFAVHVRIEHAITAIQNGHSRMLCMEACRQVDILLNPKLHESCRRYASAYRERTRTQHLDPESFVVLPSFGPSNVPSDDRKLGLLIIIGTTRTVASKSSVARVDRAASWLCLDRCHRLGECNLQNMDFIVWTTVMVTVDLLLLRT